MSRRRNGWLSLQSLRRNLTRLRRHRIIGLDTAMARAADRVQQEGEQGTIGVKVTLFADLRRFLPPGVDGPHRRVVPAGSTVAGLLAIIGVPEDADITIGVDGELADRATPLREGADVMLLSPMEGGATPPKATSTTSGERRSLPPTSQETTP